MTEPMFRYPARGIHTGKHDYDRGCRVSNNPTRKRTMRAIKRSNRRKSLQYQLI